MAACKEAATLLDVPHPGKIQCNIMCTSWWQHVLHNAQFARPAPAGKCTHFARLHTCKPEKGVPGCWILQALLPLQYARQQKYAQPHHGGDNSTDANGVTAHLHTGVLAGGQDVYFGGVITHTVAALAKPAASASRRRFQSRYPQMCSLPSTSI